MKYDYKVANGTANSSKELITFQGTIIRLINDGWSLLGEPWTEKDFDGHIIIYQALTKVLK